MMEPWALLGGLGQELGGWSQPVQETKASFDLK